MSKYKLSISILRESYSIVDVRKQTEKYYSLLNNDILKFVEICKKKYG